MVGEEFFYDTGATATQRIQDQAQHDGARVHVHLCRDVMIDEANQTQLVGIRFDNGQMLDGYTSISVGMPGMTHSYRTHGLLALLGDTNSPIVMASSRLKCHQKKYAGSRYGRIVSP